MVAVPEIISRKLVLNESGIYLTGQIGRLLLFGTYTAPTTEPTFLRLVLDLPVPVGTYGTVRYVSDILLKQIK